jgi:hypothetical protein
MNYWPDKFFDYLGDSETVTSGAADKVGFHPTFSLP